MSSKRLMINISSNILSFIVSMSISFLLTPYMVSSVGKEAYGFVGLANNFVSYAELITLALNSVASRFIAIKIHENNIEDANKYFTTVTIANIITSLILLIPAIIVVINMDKIVQVPVNILKDVQILWGLVFINFLMGVITSTYNIITFASNRLDLSAIRSIQANILRIAILVLSFSLLKPKVWYLGISAVFCTIFIFITNIKYKKRLLPQIKIKYKYFSNSIIKELLGSGIWSVVTKLGQILCDGVDLLIANIFIDASAMGTLSIAKTVPTAISGLVITISSVFSPQLTIYYAQKNTDNLISELKKSMKISGLFTSIAMSGMITLGYSFYSLWVPGENIELIQLLSVLTAQGIIITGCINSLFNIFTVVNKLRFNSYLVLLVGVLNAILVFITLKMTNLGVVAIAGISTTLLIIKNLFFIPRYAAKCLNISSKIFYKIIIRYLFSTYTITLINLIITNIIEPYTWIKLIFSGFICVIVGFFINYIILFNKEERDYFNKKLRSIIYERKKVNTIQ